jgi:hypothetical protein
MNPRAHLLAALLLLAPHAAHAAQQQSDQPACPWLTAGTAAAILGGPVLSTVKRTSTESPEGSCTFTLSQGAVLSTLEIVVARTPKPVCPTDSPKLTGIGNEATVCRLNHSPTEQRYAIDSRVRDFYLRTTLTLPNAAPTSQNPSDPQQLLERVAEQVAGNLY